MDSSGTLEANGVRIAVEGCVSKHPSYPLAASDYHSE